jgi:hypothetical protein
MQTHFPWLPMTRFLEEPKIGGLSLFWKKKTKNTNEGRLFKAPPTDRGAFRVYPSKENPVNIKVGDNKLIVIDISAGGISFNNNNFKNGATYPLEIILPEKEPITVETTIHKIDDKNICRCSIVGLSEYQEDQIHSYILARQKEEMAQNKGKISR